MITGHMTVALSGGPVTLKGWTPALTDERWYDLMKVTVTFHAIRDDWEVMQKGDIDQDIWDIFWSLVNASLVEGSKLPRGGMTLSDRVKLLHALWLLNEVDETEGKWTALTTMMSGRMTRIAIRAQKMREQQNQSLN